MIFSTNRGKNMIAIITLTVITWFVLLWLGIALVCLTDSGWIIFGFITSIVVLTVLGGLLIAGSEDLAEFIADSMEKE